METVFNKNNKIIISVLIAIAIIFISLSSWAVETYAQKQKILAGNKLKFTGESWVIYKSKAGANERNQDNKKRYLKKGEIITVVSVATDCNVICIGSSTNKEFMYYGANASEYFKKQAEKNPVKGVKLNQTTKTIKVGDTFKLKATINPTNASNKNVTWTSSDNKIATVSNGTVKGIKKGEVVIKVTTNDGSKTAKCNVKVEPKPVLKFKNERETVELGNKIDIVSKLTVKNGNKADVKWTSSNLDAATINKKTGAITIKKTGTTTITATLNGISASCKVSVVSSGVKVTKIEFNKKSGKIETGKTTTIAATVTVTPNKNANKKVTYKSSNEKIATVSAKGVVKGIKEGKTTIIATSVSDKTKTAEYSIEVKDPDVKKVTITGTTKQLARGQKLQLKAEVEPSKAKKDVTWSSNNKNVSVSKNGLVTVNNKVKNGEKAVITATSRYNKNKHATWTITIKVMVTSVKIKSSTQLEVTDKETLGVTVLPSDANNKKVTWTTSNAQVVAVNQSGVIRGERVGTAVIKAVAKDGSGVYGSCTVTVKEKKPTGIYTGQSDKNKLWGYRSAVKDTKSIQYKLLNGIGAYERRVSIDSETNIVKVDGYYCSALGTYFGSVGDKFIVTLDNGTKIKVIMCDAKGSDAQYKINGETYAHSYGSTKSFLEFYCAGKPAKKNGKYVFQEKFAGKVISIVKE